MSFEDSSSLYKVQQSKELHKCAPLPPKRRRMDDDEGPFRSTAFRGRGITPRVRRGVSNQRSNSTNRRNETPGSWRNNRNNSSGSRGRAHSNDNIHLLTPHYRNRDQRGGLPNNRPSESGPQGKINFNNDNESNNDHSYNRDNPSNYRGNGDGNRNQDRRKKFIGFKKLEEIAQSESQDAIVKITESKDAFIEILQSPIDRYDVFVLVVKCLEKVCISSFNELKLKLLTDTCNSQFIVSLKSYLMELPYPSSKAANDMYWKDQDAFWKNLIYFFESLVNTSPTLAMNRCRSLIEATSTACLEGLKERHGYNLPTEYWTKLRELKEKMANIEKMQEKSKTVRSQGIGDQGAPPENFRELSLMPDNGDLLEMKPFLRPNIVDGAYEDVEHYLDVQFRLLREDCFGPLRQGLTQYMRDNRGKKFDNIRVFCNVKFIKPYVSDTKIGSLVQIDLRTNRGFSRINWQTSKRFIYGGLVLFTKDNCRNFLVGTIQDRVQTLLVKGQIPVSLMGEFNASLYNDFDVYTMIESEVYFEPYFHVLKALQDPTFPEHLAMTQYIVEVNPEPKHPAYLTPNTVFKFGDNTMVDKDEQIDELMSVEVDDNIEEQQNPIIKFTVLQDETWPGKDLMHFNDSQMEAYKLALTHELAVIQGPPGTGKTYLGIKVAETLLRNLRDKMPGCLMLIICYTNHALDQFLEALLKSTQSIVRIGGQSRNEAMDDINLTKLRNTVDRSCEANRVFRDEKGDLRRLIAQFEHENIELDILTNGVLHTKHVRENVPQIEFVQKFYGFSNGDPLLRWLFDNESAYYRDVVAMDMDNVTDNEHEKLAKETRKRTGVVLDHEERNEAKLKELRKELASFSMVENDEKLKELFSEYKKCEDPNIQQGIRHRINILNARKELYNDMAQHRGRAIHIRIDERTNFHYIAHVDRWALYFMWIEPRIRDVKRAIGRLQAQVNAATTAYEEARMLVDIQVLRHKRVVGMTTSGAARLRKLLQTLAPPIVIVEEAAEVLEQHIITSLTKDCKHLILIGDHQQLRPSAAHMKLARDYQLEVSLFERMINNGMHSRRLGVQHRMRPEIAALICPHIYQELENHPTVHDFPDVLGMTNNLFFLTHDRREQEVVDTSHTNHEEGDLVLALANYLMQQGYCPEDVTILTAYKGQMFYMRKESDKYLHLKHVKITVVDNYQGEESKIILLSLVRNNTDNNIGFLGTANRICVALSRAKEGFYIFGNIDNLKAKSDLWRNIAVTLESNNSLGEALTLKCQNHPQSVTSVKEVKDFEEVPEGGCRLPCDYTLGRCGHRCLLLCHGYDRAHITPFTRCPRNCEKILCDLNHVCPKKCAEDCGPCKRKMTKTLPCGHDADIFCYLEPDDPAVLCHTKIEATLPDCGHKVETKCYMDLKDVKCTVKCEYRVEKCGHSCLRTCHVKDDPDHEKYMCRKACAKAKAGCTADLLGDRGEHQCNKKCHEDCDPCNVPVTKRRSTCTHIESVACNVNVDEKPCMKKCRKKLACQHFCKKICSEICGDCKEMVVKEIPDCKHKVKMQCDKTASREDCNKKCNRMMSCGHKCEGVCGKQCEPDLCTQPSQKKVHSPCGHLVTLPCNIAALPADAIDVDKMLSACREPCAVTLSCGHACVGSCVKCARGVLHAPCTQPCNRPNLCGHACSEACNQVCPPCKQPCEVRCQHTRCSSLCGAPCTPCQEPCGRRCPHGACSRRCGEACSRAACSEPCRLKLRCGHPCRGLCGEPCPPVCRTCDPENFPVDFLGDEFDDTARFVLLQDCGHVMEVENMDHLMTSDSEAIEIRRCPYCRKPIINTGRYKDLVNTTFKEEINPIKEKVFGNKRQIIQKKKELVANVSLFREKYSDVLIGVSANADIKRIYLNIHAVAGTTKKVSKLQLDMVSISLNIMDMIAESYKAYKAANLTVLEMELNKQIKLLCSAFMFKPKAGVIMKINEQQQKDLGVEIKRMHSIVLLAKLSGHASYAKEKVAKEYKSASDVVLSLFMFDDKKAMAALEALQKAIKVSGLVTRQERDLVVKAMGMKSGAWYKCPNGHFYCIGECGGAMEESKCIECGAKVGGTSHTLRPDNAHASELDGSRFAAWSQENNNMANFDLEFD